jgi:CrcB protein
MQKFLLISLGAVLGANLRYWLTGWATQRWGAAFPFGTWIINMSGSLLLGLLTALAAQRFPLDPRMRLLIAVGFLGAYTTFSTYTLESVDLISKGAWLPGLLNLFGSSAAGWLAAGLGLFLGRWLSAA